MRAVDFVKCYVERKPPSIEAVETAIWLTEVASQLGKTDKRFLEQLADANNGANAERELAPTISRMILQEVAYAELTQRPGIGTATAALARLLTGPIAQG